MVIHVFVFLFPLYLLYLSPRTLGSKMCRVPLRKGGVGAHTSLTLSMIGRWMKCTGFYWALMGREFSRMWKIGPLWRETKCVKFIIKSLYKALASGPPISFPLTVICKACVQPKVSFFGWEATWGKTLIFDQLQKRGCL